MTWAEESSPSTRFKVNERGSYNSSGFFGGLMTIGSFDTRWTVTSMTMTVDNSGSDTYHEQTHQTETGPNFQITGDNTLDRRDTSSNNLYEHGSYRGGGWTLDDYRYDENNVSRAVFHGIVDQTSTASGSDGGTGGGGSGSAVTIVVHTTIDQTQDTQTIRHDRGTFASGKFVLSSYQLQYGTISTFTWRQDGIVYIDGNVVARWLEIHTTDMTFVLQKSGNGALGSAVGSYVTTGNTHKTYTYIGGATWDYRVTDTPLNGSGNFLMNQYTLQDVTLGRQQTDTAHPDTSITVTDPDLEAQMNEFNKTQINANPLDGIILGLQVTQKVGIGILVVGSFFVGFGQCGVAATLEMAGMAGLEIFIWDVGTQVIDNMRHDRPAFDIDWGEAALSGAEGFLLAPVVAYVPGMKAVFLTINLLGIAEKAIDGNWMGVTWDILGLYGYTKAASKVCFAAETPIMTLAGWKRIKDIEPGDWVLARPEDDAHAMPECKKVEEKFVGYARLWHVHVRDQIIRSTALHRFYVWGKGWTPVCELKPGDLFSTRDGEWVTVDDICDSGVEEEVYNCRVADYHTYFVGKPEWGWSAWAHNARCGGLGPVQKGQAGAQRSKREAIRAGETVLGEEVTFELPSGRRTRSDLVTESGPGQFKVREAKNGPHAEMSLAQLEMEVAIQHGQPVIPRGKKAMLAGFDPGKPLRIQDFELDQF